MRAFDAICRTPWLITEEGLRTILAIAERRMADVDLAALIREERASRPSALAQASGRPLDGTRTAKVRDGVAILDVEGPLVRRADFFSEMSGATSVGTLALDFAEALRSPGVTSILLVVDSPGGEVTGINEFAAQIAAADKPVWAYVEGLGASAAYWLASATDHIVVDATAGLGSIGVVMAVQDPAKSTAKTIEIVSSQSPKKRPTVQTEAGRAQLQTVVDDIASVFVASVAGYRGVSEETVLSDFGQGDIFIGQRAVEQGLADAVGSFEATLAELAATARQSPQTRTRHAAAATVEGIDMAQADKSFWTNFFGGLFGAAAESGAPVAAAAAAAESTGAVTPAAPPAPAAPRASEPDPKVAALEAELAEEKAARQKAEASAAEHAAAVAKAAADARQARLTALATSFHGETAAHLTVLTALADAGGEDGPAFAAYVTTQKAAAAAIASGKLFAELGSDKPAAGGDATERFMALVTAKRKETPALSVADAMAAVAREEPELYEAHAKASSIKVG